jgi:hypothetical protein
MATRRLTRSSPLPAAGDFQIITQDGFPRLRDPNGNIMRIRPEPGTPVDLTPATATLNPAGDDNDILLTDASGERSTAQIIIDAAADRTQLSVAETDGAIVATSGDKRVMRVTADFGDGEEMVDFVYVGDLNGRPAYGDATSVYSIQWSVEETWVLLDNNNTIDESSSDTSFPDLATWPAGITVEGVPASAAQVIATLETLDDLTAENAPGSDGTGAVAAVGPVNFTGFSPSTPGAPGDMLFDGDNAYLKTETGWETLPYEA